MSPFSPIPQPLATTMLLSVTMSLAFFRFCISKSIQYLSFSDLSHLAYCPQVSPSLSQIEPRFFFSQQAALLLITVIMKAKWITICKATKIVMTHSNCTNNYF